MKGNTYRLSQKVMAVMMSIVMMISLISSSSYRVLAASYTPEELGSAITVLVTSDDTGLPIADADITFTLVSAEDETQIIEENKTVKTDDNGYAIIRKQEDCTESYKLSATISKSNYIDDSTSISNANITDGNENLSVTLVKKTISADIVKKVDGLVFNDSDQALVTFDGDTSKYTVNYKLDGTDVGSTIPKARNAGKYNVEYSVSINDGSLKPVSGTIENIEIAKKDIGITVETNTEYPYSEEGVVPFTISGVKDGDVQNYIVGTNTYTSYAEITKIKNIGSYPVSINVSRGDNYTTFTKEFTAKIVPLDITDVDFSVAEDLVYDGEEHELISSVNAPEGTDVQFSLDGTTWTTDKTEIKGTNAGNYVIYIKANRDNHNEYTDSKTAVISKKEQQTVVTITNYKNESEDHSESNIAYTNKAENFDVNRLYKISATSDYNAGDISISVADNDGILASHSSAGAGQENLFFKESGSVTVTITVPGDDNYAEKVITTTLDISAVKTIYFDVPSPGYVNYTVDDIGVVSEQIAYAKINDTVKTAKEYENKIGKTTYSIKETEGSSASSFLNINSQTGSVTVSDYEKLEKAINDSSDGTIIVTVVANKEEKRNYRGKVLYDADSAEYNIYIKFLPSPSKAANIEGLQGDTVLSDPSYKWYVGTGTNKTTVSPDASLVDYKISYSEKLNISSFVDSFTLEDKKYAGDDAVKFYLKNKEGQITNKITLENTYVDTTNPSEINLKLSEPVENKDGVPYYDQNKVTIFFDGKDVTSGIDRFEWTYKLDKTATQASEINYPEELSGIITKADITEISDGKYKAELLFPPNSEEINGVLSVKAVDEAGLESSVLSSTRFVVDMTKPTLNPEYTKASREVTTDKTVYYYNSSITATYTFTEENFFSDDVEIKITKDGKDVDTPSVTWTDDANFKNIHKGVFTIKADDATYGDGDYVITVDYTDRSNNKMDTYTSDKLVIDTTKPEIDFSYDSKVGDVKKQEATVTINEHNFRPNEISVTPTETYKYIARDINGNEVTVTDLQSFLRNATWSDDGDVHTVKLPSSSPLVDAIYNFNIDYNDLATNEADTKNTGDFIVDHTAPDVSKLSISYSEPITSKIISNLTFGYYNPTVKVTFTGYDVTSGIDYFTWSYARQSSASATNVKDYAEAKVTAVQDSKDKSKFTATVEMPKSEADQIRGTVAITATDKYTNRSNKLTDSGNIIVVDTIAPNMTAEYTEPDRTVGNKMFYSKDITATITVNEANFYSEDVVITITKDGKDFSGFSTSWNDVSTDKHIATIKLSAAEDGSSDGDYILSVNYTDRSSNKMTAYSSNTLVVDQTAPLISVIYDDTTPENSLQDSEGHKRDYFNDTQVATVTITEHNFNEEEVDIRIDSKDVQGNSLKASDSTSQSKWSHDGDVHTRTITYSGDANYTFDIDYTDQATNKAADYAENYFTVDKTAPTDLSVSYSSSVLDTVLQNVSFGFYNAKMTVTITANDATSPIHAFKYDYKNTAGVSSVNSELLNQAIEEATISYSDSNRTATATFEIPQAVLTSNNQFNGTVDFTATDRANNESTSYDDTKRIVVDNISPNANVSYNTPVNVEGGTSYYDDSITATVTINEANFYSEDVQISVTKDGGSYPVSAGWSNNSTDTHVGTFTMTEDGEYHVSITYTDKSRNAMATYTSETLIIDTDADAKDPIIRINKKDDIDGTSYKNECVPSVEFEDDNLDDYEIELVRTRREEKNVNVNEQYIKDHVTVSDTAGSGEFDEFKKVQDNDGIYKLSIKISDKAGHERSSEATFIVNRYGSVYVYSDYLIDLISDGGKYVKSVDEDLVITEYNPDQLVAGSLKIDISADGKPIDTAEFTTTPEINNKAQIGDSGWYQYDYNISKDNFAKDGVYKMVVSSEDTVGNTPENTNYEDKAILFRVDSTPPEINSISGLENNIINATNVNVKYTVYDTIGLKSVVTYVDGNEVENITDFTEDSNNYSGNFTLQEKSSSQDVRIVVEDLAGNITDTSSDDFSSAYDFNKSVTVSTNFFVRWFANKPLFFGSIGGFIVVVGGLFFLIFALKRRKEEQGQ